MGQNNSVQTEDMVAHIYHESTGLAKLQSHNLAFSAEDGFMYAFNYTIFWFNVVDDIVSAVSDKVAHYDPSPKSPNIRCAPY